MLRKTAGTGQGGGVLVSGEPGIGKTALVSAITEEAKRVGFAVGVSKAEENDRIAPMAPLLFALRSGPEPLLSAAEFAELAPLYHQQLWLIDRLAGMLEERALRSPVPVYEDVPPSTKIGLHRAAVERFLPSGVRPSARRPMYWPTPTTEIAKPTTNCAERPSTG